MLFCLCPYRKVRIYAVLRFVKDNAALFEIEASVKIGNLSSAKDDVSLYVPEFACRIHVEPDRSVRSNKTAYKRFKCKVNLRTYVKLKGNPHVQASKIILRR